MPEKKKKRKKESLMSDYEEPSGLGNYEAAFPRVLGDLHSLVLDPFHPINRGRTVNVRKVLLRFRSLVFQKSINLSPLADDDGNDTHSTKSLSENGVRVPPVKSQAGLSGRPDDPTKGGRKQGPSYHQEELAAKKKKKVGDIKNLTQEKKVIKKFDEPAARGDVMPLRKTGPEFIKKTEKRASKPTMLMVKLPTGGSLPSINELKARFACYGPMDHLATCIFWNTCSCCVVYKHKIDTQAAYKFVVGSGSLFGNTDVKCMLKGVGESEPPVKPPKEDHQPAMYDRPTPPGVQLKSILKKSNANEATGVSGNTSRGMPRVKFMLGEDESDEKKKNVSSFSSSSSTTDATMDVKNSKNFHKAVLQSSSSNPLPLPPPTSTSINITTPPPPGPQPHFSKILWRYGGAATAAWKPT